MKSILTLLVFGALITGAFAQRPRTMEAAPSPKSEPRAAPKTVKAKYEGGVFGYTKTMEGTLTLDDENARVLFKDKKTPKEISIPYESLTGAFGDTKKVQPAAATVASSVPVIFTMPAKFIKTKVRYLTLQYSDPDSKQNGVTSFRLENKELLESVLATLARKTGMTLRGDIYVKKRDDSSQFNP
jgi:hypothetical protein